MKFVHLDLTLGEDWQIPIEFNKGDDTDLDVTGATEVIWYLKGTGYDTNLYMTRTLADGIELGASGTGGIVTGMLTVTPEEQLAMNPIPIKGQYRNELSVKLGSGIRSIQAGGPVSLHESIRWAALLAGESVSEIPDNVLTLGGEPLMLGDEYLTLGA
jgi:hypothetical protein